MANNSGGIPDFLTLPKTTVSKQTRAVKTVLVSVTVVIAGVLLFGSCAMAILIRSSM